MVRHLATHSRQSGAFWLSLPAITGAVAALVLPGATSSTSAGAALLAVGALALLAGHGWGLTVSIPSHVAVAGQVWPNLALHAPGSSFDTAATAIILVTALPALALAVLLVPRVARELPAHQRRIFMTGAALVTLAALVLPAL